MPEEVTLGEVYRAVLEIKANMVTKETNEVVIESLRLADATNAAAIQTVSTRLDEADKDIKSAGRARVNMWIAAGLAVIGSLLVKLFVPGSP